MNMMKNLAAAVLLLVMGVPAYAGSAPNWTYGYVPTSAEWNAEFASKEDELGYRPVNSAGDTMSGRLITAAPGATTSGFNMAPGSTPAGPSDGDMWVTTVGLFVRINGTTVGPLIGASGTNFAATSPLTVAASAGLVTYACPTCGVTGSPLSQFAATSSAQLAGVLSDETGTGVVVFSTSPVLTTPNLGTPSAIVLTSGTGLPVASGISGLATGMATFLATPTSANLAATVTNETGSGNLVFSTSPTLVTPVLGAATATSVTMSDSGLITNGSTSGTLVLRAAATAGSSVVRFPAGSTDLSATGGTSQVVRQSSAGAALTVGQLAASDLSNGTTGTGAAVLSVSPALTGAPTAPTAAVNTNTTQVASTAFVVAQVAATTAGVAQLNSLTGSLNIVAGKGTSVTAAGSSITVANSLTNASFDFLSAISTGATATTSITIGAGASCKITPAYSGRVHVNFNVANSNSGGGFGQQISLIYGTGTAPSAGAASSGVGTVARGPYTITTSASETQIISLNANITGLTVGTTYWFDFTQTSTGSQTVTDTVACSGSEY